MLWNPPIYSGHDLDRVLDPVYCMEGVAQSSIWYQVKGKMCVWSNSQWMKYSQEPFGMQSSSENGQNFWPTAKRVCAAHMGVTTPCSTISTPYILQLQHFVNPQLPNIPHYLAEAIITVTNNFLPWVRDLHSAGLQIGTTESITSHNESFQVVKWSAIAKHLTEWSGILWKTAIPQGIQQRWDSTGCSRLHMQSSPICSSWQTVIWENYCANCGIGCHQLKIETGRYPHPVPPPTANVENEIHFLIECQKYPLWEKYYTEE